MECYDLTADDSVVEMEVVGSSLDARRRAPGSGSQDDTRDSPGFGMHPGVIAQNIMVATSQRDVESEDNSMVTGCRVPGSGRLDATRASPGFIDRVVKSPYDETVAANFRDVEI